MSAPTRFMATVGVALVVLLTARDGVAQRTITINGRTVPVPEGVEITPEMMEQARKHMPPGGPGPHGPKPPEAKKAEEEKKEGEGEKKPEEKKDSAEKKEGEATSVKRESTPPEEPDPDELKVRPNEKGMVDFNFANQPWLGVLDWLATISNKNLDWQELPGDYLNLTTRQSYSVEETGDLINMHLLMRGYTLLQTGESLSVAKVEGLDPGLVPRVTPEQLDERMPHEFVKVSFPLTSLLAETAVKELEPMKSPNGKLSALVATNRMEAMDSVLNLRQIRDVLAEEQTGTGQEQQVRKFPLEYTSAEDVLGQLQDLLGIQSSKNSSPGRPMTPQEMAAQQQAMKAAMEAAKQGGGAPKPKAEIYLIAKRHDNSIIAHAPPDKMALIEQSIKALDVPSENAHTLFNNIDRMQIYRLENVDPDAVIKVLEDLGDLDFNTRLEADNENRAIVAYASLADHMTIQSVVMKLDSGGRGPQVIQLVDLRAETVAEVINFMMGGGKEEESSNDSRNRSFFPFFSPYGRSGRGGSSSTHNDQFRVDANAKNNTLLLWCNKFELAKVEELLEHLREVPSVASTTPNKVEVYRLVTLDPESLVKTLEAMDTLDFYTKLEVDEENNAVIAYASEADHGRISELISTLDGSGRQFHVVPLRRLEADYVSGTIAFMMSGKGEDSQSSGYSRTYVYNEYYGGGSRGGKSDKSDEFRVDADVEYNRLLLWANEIEMDEVKNLLVKLGEIPPDEGDTRTIRVLDVAPGAERDLLLERIRRIWPSLAPNKLDPPPEKSADSADAEEPAEAESEEEPAPAKAEAPVASLDAKRPVFRFAQLQQTADDPPTADTTEAAATEEPKPSEEAADTTEAAATEEPKPSEQPADTTKAPSTAEPKPSEEAADTTEAAATAEPKPSEQPADTTEAAATSEPESTEEAAEVPEVPEKPTGPPPPVSITETPDGRLIITSEDTGALDQLEELIGRLAPPRKDYEVFQLKYAEAYWVSWNLKDFFEEEEDDNSSRNMDWYWGYPSRGNSQDSTRRLSQRRPLRFISDDDSNTILVQGADSSQLRTIQELIELYDQPPSTDSQSVRKTEVFPIRYSEAEIVAEAVKEVYRDLLSDRDKALAKGGEQQQRPESRYAYTYLFGDDESERKLPRWKGYLSIGIDQLSNSLVVSAPEFLFVEIEDIISQLDEAARPTDAVQAVQIGKGMSVAGLKEVLDKMLNQKSSRGGGGGQTPNRPGGPPRPPNGRNGR